MTRIESSYATASKETTGGTGSSAMPISTTKGARAVLVDEPEAKRDTVAGQAASNTQGRLAHDMIAPHLACAGDFNGRTVTLGRGRRRR